MSTATKGTLRWFLSGGPANSDPTLSLGGAMSNALVPQAIMGNAGWQLALSGYVNYRCVYLKNTNTEETAVAADLWLFIKQQLSGPDTLNIQVDPAGVGDGLDTGLATTIPDEVTAPSGVTFPGVPPVGESEHLPEIPLLGPEEAIALWLKRNIPASSVGTIVSMANIGFTWGR